MSGGLKRHALCVETLFHIARAADWHQAKRDGAYRISTLGKRLDEEGYIHLSFAHQVQPVADRLYRGMEDLLLLEVEPGRLTAPVVVEPGDGTDERFPHLYGELPIDAVVAVDGYRPDDEGHFPAVDGTRRAGKPRAS
jgi:glutathione S-transferase